MPSFSLCNSSRQSECEEAVPHAETNAEAGLIYIVTNSLLRLIPSEAELRLVGLSVCAGWRSKQPGGLRNKPLGPLLIAIRLITLSYATSGGACKNDPTFNSHHHQLVCLVAFLMLHLGMAHANSTCERGAAKLPLFACRACAFTARFRRTRVGLLMMFLTVEWVNPQGRYK